VQDDDDDRLMAAFCRGDESAFVRLYERHARPLHGFLLRLLGEPTLAEDVLQTTFLSVVKGRGRYEPGTSVRAWLYTVAANAGRDALRRNKVRRETGLSADGAPEGLVAEQAFGDPAAMRLIERALQGLSPDQREAVILHKVHGFSFEEIARMVGISATAAKVRAHRGYERLRALLGAQEVQFE